MAQLTTKRCSAGEIQAHVDELAALRIRVFRDFPYLYDGDLDYEREYLATYVNSPRSLAFLVHDGDRLVGATTALPLADEEAAFKAPLAEAGFDVDRVFYFGESLLLGDYRGHGLGHRFFDEREAWARQAGDFSHACFCTVERPKTTLCGRPATSRWMRSGSVAVLRVATISARFIAGRISIRAGKQTSAWSSGYARSTEFRAAVRALNVAGRGRTGVEIALG